MDSLLICISCFLLLFFQGTYPHMELFFYRQSFARYGTELAYTPMLQLGCSRIGFDFADPFGSPESLCVCVFFFFFFKKAQVGCSFIGQVVGTP